MGVIPIHDTMTAMQGRLAWNCHLGKSLMARAMEAKYSNGKKGSYVWEIISFLMQQFRENSRWILGRGDTTIDVICRKLGSEAPGDIAQFPIKDVLLNTDMSQRLRTVLPTAVMSSFDDYVPDNVPDRLAWKGSTSGCFTTKAFRKSFATQYPSRNWGSTIWQSWIPKKISCFVWRLLHRGLPTDDNVRRISIPLVSRCICCFRQEETIDHLFYNGAWGKKVWSFMHNVFGISKPHCIEDISRLWIGCKKPESMLDGVRIGMLCFFTWEIGHARNALIHEGKNVNIIREALRWLRLVGGLIHLPLNDSGLAARKLFCLGISSHECRRSKWLSWAPSSSGWTINMAFLFGAHSSRMGYVVRNIKGDFKIAGSTSFGLHGLHGLIWGFTHVIRLCAAIGD